MYNGECVSEVVKGQFSNRTHLQNNSKDGYFTSEDILATTNEGQEDKGDKKLIKILQRPISAHSVDGRQEEAPRRSHRKKTLSLNPEEREALESLIEDVIIVGLDDAIVDSDDSADDLQSWCSHRFPQKSGTDALRSSSNRDNRGSRVRTNHENKVDILQKPVDMASAISRNNSNKDFRSRDSSFGNSKNISKENNREMPQSLHQLSTKGNDEESKEKAMNGMIGVNIYPAQLKVAIKHMDSLPPRFLRRLQSGQARIGGSDPALQNLTESPVNRDILLKAGEGSIITQSSSTPSSVEKDKSKSKQNHIFETKKSIRNLLDQYSDDITHSNDIGDDYKRVDSLPSVPMDAFKSTSFENRNGLFRSQPNQMFGSDPHLNFDAYSPMEFMNLPLMTRNSQREFLQPSADRSNLFMNQFMQNGTPHNVSPKPGSTLSHPFSYNTANGYVPPDIQLAAHLPPKKTNLKPDAPVFVSNYHKGNKTVDQARVGSNEIAFLPGVLNTENHHSFKKQGPLDPQFYMGSANMTPFKNQFVERQTQYNMGIYRGQQFSPPNSHNYLASSPGAWTADVPSMEAAMPWFTGYHIGGDGMKPQGDVWMGFNNVYSNNEVLDVDLGRQRVVELLSAGRCVMVLLLGNPDGSKLSELQIAGAHVLNLRNNVNVSGSPTKQKEQQDWNYRQAVEAVENKKSLIIVDHTFGKPWEIQQYINLAQRNGFEVQVIDGSQHYPSQDNIGMYMPPPTNGFKPHVGMTSQIYRDMIANQMLPHHQQQQEFHINSDYGINIPLQPDFSINHA